MRFLVRVQPMLILLAACTPRAADESPAPLEVRPGVEMATVTGVEPGEALTLYDPSGAERLTLLADNNGQAHFSYIPSPAIGPLTLDTREGVTFPLTDGDVLVPGAYRIDAESGASTGTFQVLALEDVPDPALYDQQVLTGTTYSALSGEIGDPQDGFQYIETRDGTLLSVMVRFPDPLLYGDGPYPTVFEYSGYSPSRPDRTQSGLLIANALGYATVGVNMRGSGCSGGVFDVFNRAQHADGYDVAEVVGRQDWVLGNRVGMVGLSYPGISQLYVASTNPPSLAAVVPLSVIADAWEMQYPGGVYNSGFTQQWLDQRDAEAAVQGTSWVEQQIVEQGDTVCDANQALSTQNIDFEVFFAQLGTRPAAADARDLNTLVEQIEMPVFLGGTWQDEQTGANFGSMTDRFINSPNSRFLLQNGRHPDGFAPDSIYRWFEFLEFYVARRVPRLNPLLRSSIGADGFGSAFGFTDFAFEEDRFFDFDDEQFDEALAAYESELPVRVLFESGAGGMDVGTPVPTFEHSYARWPPDEAEEFTWHLGEGTLLPAEPADSTTSSFDFDPEAGDQTFFGPAGYQLTIPLWDIDWQPFAPNDVAVFDTPFLPTDTVLAGPGILDLWVRSSTEQANLQATLSEIRPDGVEVLIQSGWLRLGHRHAERGGDRRLLRSYSAEDFETMPAGAFVQAQVAIPSFAHPVRAGSRVRLSVSTPGRNHGTWRFTDPDLDPSDPPVIDIQTGPGHGSQLLLAELPGLPIPVSAPACPSLRGQPCRLLEL